MFYLLYLLTYLTASPPLGGSFLKQMTLNVDLDLDLLEVNSDIVVLTLNIRARFHENRTFTY